MPSKSVFYCYGIFAFGLPIGPESQTSDKRVPGLTIFDNSFGQRSQYLYTGKKWRQFDSDNWHFELTAGLIHGYKEPYEDKIPFNDLGVAPAIVPALSYQNKALTVEFAQLGLSAGLITLGFTFLSRLPGCRSGENLVPAVVKLLRQPIKWHGITASV